MALTDSCDVFASLSEVTFNNLIANIRRQRPSLFNYGTQSFVVNPLMMCSQIETSPGLPNNQPRISFQPLIPVPGTEGRWGMEYCMQLTKLQVDFHPGQLNLPSQLNPPLSPQNLALRLQVCGGIGCPSLDTLNKLGVAEAYTYPSVDSRMMLTDAHDQKVYPRGIRELPIDQGKIHCFCLDLYAIASFRKETVGDDPILSVELKGLEIVNIQPEGLENTIECLLTTTIVLGMLPKIRLALNDIILSLGSYGKLKIGLTPISANVPFNPSVANDRFSVFVNINLN